MQSLEGCTGTSRTMSRFSATQPRGWRKKHRTRLTKAGEQPSRLESQPTCEDVSRARTIQRLWGYASALPRDQYVGDQDIINMLPNFPSIIMLVSVFLLLMTLPQHNPSFPILVHVFLGIWGPMAGYFILIVTMSLNTLPHLYLLHSFTTDFHPQLQDRFRQHNLQRDFPSKNVDFLWSPFFPK